MNIAHEKGNFLNKEQKKIKASIVATLLAIIPMALKNYEDKFTDEELSILLMTVYINYNREMITGLIKSSDIKKDNILEFITNILGVIKQSVLDELGINDKAVH